MNQYLLKLNPKPYLHSLRMFDKIGTRGPTQCRHLWRICDMLPLQGCLEVAALFEGLLYPLVKWWVMAVVPNKYTQLSIG